MLTGSKEAGNAGLTFNTDSSNKGCLQACQNMFLEIDSEEAYHSIRLSIYEDGQAVLRSVPTKSLVDTAFEIQFCQLIVANTANGRLG
ncbi:hypothetical protein Hypma_009393 [Hypsizygus marmoreus]|uniref:Uncharacterized protein n=1 Tax=Hypsizygus marmoreus TaxID=39966 RepID=A0A369JR14_HYPMA|nr:hypothetical protein Hypma_009393 [Hypsizygus marmoreus]